MEANGAHHAVPTILFGSFGTAIGLATVFIGFLQFRNMRRRRSKRNRSVEEGHELPTSTDDNARSTDDCHSEDTSDESCSLRKSNVT